MKKISFLLGFATGFLVGSRAGTGPYEQVQARVRAVGSRPEVQDTVASAKEAVHDRVEDVADRAAAHVSTTEQVASGSI